MTAEHQKRIEELMSDKDQLNQNIKKENQLMFQEVS